MFNTIQFNEFNTSIFLKVSHCTCKHISNQRGVSRPILMWGWWPEGTLQYHWGTSFWFEVRGRKWRESTCETGILSWFSARFKDGCATTPWSLPRNLLRWRRWYHARIKVIRMLLLRTMQWVIIVFTTNQGTTNNYIMSIHKSELYLTGTEGSRVSKTLVLELLEPISDSALLLHMNWRVFACSLVCENWDIGPENRNSKSVEMVIHCSTDQVSSAASGKKISNSALARLRRPSRVVFIDAEGSCTMETRIWAT